MMELREMETRVDRLREILSCCRLCRRMCGADRLAGERGYCGAGERLEVASTTVHTGEEPVLTGSTGVGNVFLGRCNLRCVYCQNHTISQTGPGTSPEWGTTPGELAAELLDFQRKGCPTAGFVSPTHYAPQLFEAVLIAARRGFGLPLIYNTNAYDSMELLELLDGMVDIYLPDIRYSDPEMAKRYSDAPAYPSAALEAVREMHRQVGGLELDDGGTAVRGVIVRLLVLPGGVSGTEEVMASLAGDPGTTVFISLMSQYYPVHRAFEHPPLDRRLDPAEYSRAERAMRALGFRNGWVQDPVESPDSYRPGVDFRL